MYISDTDTKKKNRDLNRPIVVYMILSITAIIIDNVYALFGHGVRSAAMSWMFLYPLLGGTLVYLLIELLIPAVKNSTGFRLFFNTYNSGIAILTVGSFLNGILEIAGADSPYTIIFNAVGWILTMAGLTIFVLKNAAVQTENRIK